MDMHNHVPVIGNWPIRLWKYSKAALLGDRNTLVQWRSKTALCKECGALLRMPKALDIAKVFLPVLFISSYIPLAAPIYDSNLPGILKPILIFVVAKLIALIEISIVNGFCLTFGKWTVVDMEGKDQETRIMELREEAENEGKHYWKTRNGIAQLAFALISFFLFLYIFFWR